MKFKPGINTTRVQPELNLGLFVADGVWRGHGHELVITSLNDGKHSRTSLHYAGQAVDLRTNYFSDPHLVAADLRAALGENPDYDVVVEETHIHFEWQPKFRAGAK